MATTTAPDTTTTVPGPIYVDTQHEDFVHDAQLDFYGAKLATCSSDRTIKVYDVFESSYELASTLQGHEGPVWQVSWAHPKFGVLLASCSFDGSVMIHRESRPREWTLLHEARHLHESSINGIAFGPHEHGLVLAAASSDGRVSILKHTANSSWTVDYLDDCPMGVNALSWAPYGAYYDSSSSSTAPTSSQVDKEGTDGNNTTNNQTSSSSSSSSSSFEAPRLVTAGCDNQIRFWICDTENDGQWKPDVEAPISKDLQHSDWVRDVAWAPTLLPGQNTVASCSEDRTVLIWKQTSPKGEWKATLLHTFDAPVWRVSWSVTGHLLAVSSGDADVSLWKAGLDGKWTQVSTVTEEPQPQQS